MIDITTSISPIEREYHTGISIEKWVGSIAIKEVKMTAYYNGIL